MAKPRRLNREIVIETAAGLADEAGDHQAVTLTALAAALDVRPPSLYNHLAGLDDLHQGLALLGLRLLTDEVRQAAAGLAGRAALLAIADAYRSFARAHPGLYPLTIRAAGPEEPELAAAGLALLQYLQLVLASCGLAGDAALHAIRGLRAVLHGFVSLEAAGGYKMALDVGTSYRLVVERYLDGLASKAQTS
jgi:AcrR family transcriptional regulator